MVLEPWCRRSALCLLGRPKSFRVLIRGGSFHLFILGLPTRGRSFHPFILGRFFGVEQAGTQARHDRTATATGQTVGTGARIRAEAIAAIAVVHAAFVLRKCRALANYFFWQVPGQTVSWIDAAMIVKLLSRSSAVVPMILLPRALSTRGWISRDIQPSPIMHHQQRRERRKV